MSIFSGTELKRFRQGRLPKISLVVLLVIPLIYGALYLWAFWAPDENMDHLPVGLVNLDEPAQTPDGERLAAGDDVVTELLEGQDLNWQVLTATEAHDQVANGDVYFSVTIPEDFSASFAELADDPRAGKIIVDYNENNSFLASTLGKQAMLQLQAAVAETATERSADEILVGVQKLSDGTRDAAEAAETLDSGAGELAEGTETLEAGLGELAAGTSELVANTPQLLDGTNQLAAGADEAAAKTADLRDGLGALHSGAGDLATKLDTAANASAELSRGAQAVAAGTKPVAEGTATIAAGVNAVADALDDLLGKLPQLTDGGDQLQAGAGELASGSSHTSAGVQAIANLAAEHPEMTLAELDATLQGQGTSLAELARGTDAVAAGAQALNEHSGELTEGLHSLHNEISAASTRLPELVTGVNDLADGAQQLSAGADDLAAGARDLAGGTAQLADGGATLSSKTAQAHAGSSLLADGVGQLSGGAHELAAGGAELASGAHALNEGAHTAHEGSGELSAGTTELKDGTEEFASELKEGAEEAPTFTDADIADMSATLASPVELDENVNNEVQGFGEGFAPFFIALATFVGALITWLILRALPRRPLATNTSGFRTVMTGFWPAALIGLGQAIIMMLVLIYAVGMQPAHPAGMFTFMLIVTLAFLALQQMFIIVFGTATGRVISLVLLMLQLSSSGGTYPVETTPKFFQVLHPYMPASYVVSGMRELVGGDVSGRFWLALSVMLGILLISLAISAVSARRQKMWTVSRLHPSLAI